MVRTDRNEVAAATKLTLRIASSGLIANGKAARTRVSAFIAVLEEDNLTSDFWGVRDKPPALSVFPGAFWWFAAGWTDPETYPW